MNGGLKDAFIIVISKRFTRTQIESHQQHAINKSSGISYAPITSFLRLKLQQNSNDR